MKYIFFIFILITITGCGFRPMLASNSSYEQNLEEIRLNDVSGEDKPRLQRIISETLGTHSHLKPLYNLNVTISKYTSRMAIQKDSVSTRYMVGVNLIYQLTYIENNKAIDQGIITLSNSYDVEASDSEFAYYISEQYVSDNLLKELAEELKIRLGLVLSSQQVK